MVKDTEPKNVNIKTITIYMHIIMQIVKTILSLVLIYQRDFGHLVEKISKKCAILCANVI